MSQELRKKISYHQTELRRLRKQLRKSKGLGPKRKGLGCRDRDEAMKIARGYGDPSTFVRRDGSEKLVGEDWIDRKVALAYRSKGYCERFTILGKPHAAFCDGKGGEPHHIIKRSVKRDDRLSNLADLSRACHEAETTSQRPRKPKWSFAVKPAPESEQQV